MILWKLKESQGMYWQLHYCVASQTGVYHLSYVDMHGQCYDRSINMSGAKNGCKSIVQKHTPMATYTHCAAHRLNLAIVSACNIQTLKAQKLVLEVFQVLS